MQKNNTENPKLKHQSAVYWLIIAKFGQSFSSIK